MLATAYFGGKAGLEVEAVLVPQPRTPHVVEVLRASVAAGLRPLPVSSWAAVPFALSSRIRPATEVVPPGGSSGWPGRWAIKSTPRASLAMQVREGGLPEPDVCVVALGSGGTAAGLAAGLQAEGLSTRVVGVCVASPRWLVRASVRRLTRGCDREIARSSATARSTGASYERLSVDERFLGRGYGYPTDEGAAATRDAASVGLALDPTYTAKAFACALWYVRARRAERVLYWHTLSSAPMEPLLAHAKGDLPPDLARLVTL